MNATSRKNIRRARNALVSLAIAGGGLAAFAATSGVAEAAPAGYVTVISCSSVSGQVLYSPGLLTTKARSTTGRVIASVSNCTGELGSPGVGTLVATLSGTASLSNESFASGTFTIDWPGGQLNPSSGTLAVTESNGFENVSGTITSGALAGEPMSWTYVTDANTGRGTARKPVTAQQFITAQPLIVQENIG